MKTKTKEITVTPQEEVRDVSVESFISQAIQTNVPIETLERLLAMRDKIKAEKAKEAFDSAMADFQGECPVIQKTKDGGKTNSGQVAYKYAPLESIVEQTKSLIQKYGFSYAIQTHTETDKVKVTCIVKHSAGHQEQSDIEMPLGTRTQVMSAPQVVAAALTFAKRYAFCNAFGIMTGDEDTDAKDVEKDAPKTDLMAFYKTKLSSAKSLDELKKIWFELPVDAQIELEGLKSDLKMSLEN